MSAFESILNTPPSRSRSDTESRNLITAIGDLLRRGIVNSTAHLIHPTLLPDLEIDVQSTRQTEPSDGERNNLLLQVTSAAQERLEAQLSLQMECNLVNTVADVLHNGITNYLIPGLDQSAHTVTSNVLANLRRLAESSVLEPSSVPPAEQQNAPPSQVSGHVGELVLQQERGLDRREDSSRDAGVETTRNPNGSSFVRNGVGDIDLVTDARGRETRLGYSNGKVISFEREGRRWRSSDGENFVEQVPEDETAATWRGRVTVRPDGTVEYTSLDGRTENGLRVDNTDGTRRDTYPDGRTLVFDSDRRITQVTDGRGWVTRFEYSGQERHPAVMEDVRGRYRGTGSDTWICDNPNRTWRGTVQVDQNTGEFVERNPDGTNWTAHFDGSRTVQHPSGASITTDRIDRVTAMRSRGNNPKRYEFTYTGQNTQPTRIYTRQYHPFGDAEEHEFNRPPGTSRWFEGEITDRVPDFEGTILVDRHTGTILRFGTNDVTTELLDGDRRQVSNNRVERVGTRALAIFDRLDTNGNGYITRSELAAAVESRGYTGENAQVLAALYRHFDAIKRLSSDERGWESDISREDLRALERLESATPQDAQREGSSSETQLVLDVRRAAARAHRAQVLAARADYAVFHGANPVTADAIHQGSLGDCAFMAALSAVAQSNPQSIRNMIRDNGNGTLTVTFPGDRNNPITVSRPTDSEMGIYGHGNGSGLWPCILEKAYCSRCMLSGVTRTTYEAGGLGGFGGSQLELLTGGDTSWHIVRASSQDRLRTALANNRAVMCGTGPDWLGARSQETPDGFARPHAYAVTGIDTEGRVTVRNPWGGNDRSGTFTMPWEEFQRNFLRVIIQD